MKKTLINGRWLFMVVVFLLLIVLGAVCWAPAEWWYAAIVIGIGGIAFLAYYLLFPRGTTGSFRGEKNTASGIFGQNGKFMKRA